MPFEKIMERSGGPKEATDVWVIRFRNFKTFYYLSIWISKDSSTPILSRYCKNLIGKKYSLNCCNNVTSRYNTNISDIYSLQSYILDCTGHHCITGCCKLTESRINESSFYRVELFNPSLRRFCINLLRRSRFNSDRSSLSNLFMVNCGMNSAVPIRCLDQIFHSSYISKCWNFQFQLYLDVLCLLIPLQLLLRC